MGDSDTDGVDLMTEHIITEERLTEIIENAYKNGFNDGQAEGLPSALKAEREKMLKELKDTCTQIDDNDQYYMWLEDVESVLLRGEP